MSGSAFAVDLVNTLGSCVGGGSGLTVANWNGQKFTTNANTSTLSAVTINMGAGNTAATGTYGFYLFSNDNNRGEPSTQIGSGPFFTGDASQLPVGSYVQVTASGLSIPLQASTSYWIILEPITTANTLEINLQNGCSGTGSFAGDYPGNPWYVDNTWSLAARIQADLPAPTPTSTPIPTLSEWSLIALAFMVSSLLFLHKKRESV